MNNDHNQLEKSSQKNVQIFPVGADYFLSNCNTCARWYSIDMVEATYQIDCKWPCGHHGLTNQEGG
jgi:hypothetical protein